MKDLWCAFLVECSRGFSFGCATKVHIWAYMGGLSGLRSAFFFCKFFEGWWHFGLMNFWFRTTSPQPRPSQTGSRRHRETEEERQRAEKLAKTCQRQDLKHASEAAQFELRVLFFWTIWCFKEKIRIHGSGVNTSIYTNESKSKFSDTVPIFFWEKRLVSLLWSLYIGRCIAQEFLHNRTPSLKAMALLWCENTGYPPTTWQHGRPILTCLDAWRVALSSTSCGKGHGPATRRFGALALRTLLWRHGYIDRYTNDDCYYYYCCCCCYYYYYCSYE